MPAPSLYSLAFEALYRREGISVARRIQHYANRRRLFRSVRAIRRYRYAASDFDFMTTDLDTPWREMSRLMYTDHIMHEDDPELVRFLMDATKIRLQMHRFVRNMREHARRMRRYRYIDLVYRSLQFELFSNGDTWRNMTRRISGRLAVEHGSLQNQPNMILRGLVVGTQQRLAMQRFVRCLRLLVQRERQRHLARSRDDPFDRRRLRRRLRSTFSQT